MGMLKLDAVVHWSIPVNNLEEAENFYGEILGLEHVGRLGQLAAIVFQARQPQHYSMPAQRTDYAHHRAGWPVASRFRREPGDV